MRKELLKGLTEEQIKKVETCKSSEEILALAKEEGVELSDEQLEAVSGGCGSKSSKVKCAQCNSENVEIYGHGHKLFVNVDYDKWRCNDCGYTWEWQSECDSGNPG